MPEHNPDPEQERDPDDNTSLVDELGIVDIYEPMAGLDGKIFCTAGRDAPVAEFSDEFLILHPPQLPLYEKGPEEEIVVSVDERGIVLDELGLPKKIPTAKYKGYPIYYFGEQKEGTLRHYAAALKEDGTLHFIFNETGERLTTDFIYKLRNKSVNGEISKFPGLSSDLDEVSGDDDRVDASAMVNTEIQDA
jgi:hypothetical protein